MTQKERRRALLELGIALLVFAACIGTGLWLASLGPPEHRFDAPDEPMPVAVPSATLAPVTRDPFTASTPSPAATLRPDAAPAASAAPVPIHGAVTGAAPAAPRASSAPSRPVAVPSRPVDVPPVPIAAPTATPTPPPVVLTPPKPCVISVLGVCVRL